jgi:hypothetical protein
MGEVGDGDAILGVAEFFRHSHRAARKCDGPHAR